jgi:hypothetical protein
MSNVCDMHFSSNKFLFDYLGANSCRSERYKLFYVATPKVACTSLKWWFAELEGCAGVLREVTDSAETDPDLVIHDSLYKVAPTVAGLSASELLEIINSTDYFKFAVVRNPYKRIFSAWQSKLLLREPLQVEPYRNFDFYNHVIEYDEDIAKAFEGFLEHLAVNEVPNYLDVHWTPQTTLLRPDLIDYSKIVKIEDVSSLRLELVEWLGTDYVDPFAVRRTNESLIPYLPRYITARSSELICMMYSKDFELFDYSKTPPCTRDVFTADQFELANRAISMIRARHRRFGEIYIHFKQQTEFAKLQAQQLLAQRELLEIRAAEWAVIAGQSEHSLHNLTAQRDSWKSAAAESEQSLFWMSSQRDAWQETAAAHEQSLLWMSSQRDAWQETAAAHEQSLHWMVSQRDAWEAVAIEHADILNRTRSRLGKRVFNLLSKK